MKELADFITSIKPAYAYDGERTYVIIGAIGVELWVIEGYERVFEVRHGSTWALLSIIEQRYGSVPEAERWLQVPRNAKGDLILPHNPLEKAANDDA